MSDPCAKLDFKHNCCLIYNLPDSFQVLHLQHQLTCGMLNARIKCAIIALNSMINVLVAVLTSVHEMFNVPMHDANVIVIKIYQT